MHRLDHDADALWLEHVLHRLRDLLGEPLLHLEPAREHVDDARQLGQADDLAIGDVRDVRASEEREHVVLAQRIELDVAHHDHAAVRFAEHRVAHHVAHVHVVTAREPSQRVGDALRSLFEPLALGVFADQLQRAMNHPLELGVVLGCWIEVEPPVVGRRFERAGVDACARGESARGPIDFARVGARTRVAWSGFLGGHVLRRSSE